MSEPDHTEIPDLLDRIARVTAAEDWSAALNPAQRSALAYLARTNVFSRSPSNVADFMCTTRGTASQTLKALAAKGYVEPTRSDADKRSISYDVTPTGRVALDSPSELGATLNDLPKKDAAALAKTLAQTARNLLGRRGFRSFGVCRTCKHHQHSADGRSCMLLEIALTETTADEICHEHSL